MLVHYMETHLNRRKSLAVGAVDILFTSVTLYYGTWRFYAITLDETNSMYRYRFSTFNSLNQLFCTSNYLNADLRALNAAGKLWHFKSCLYMCTFCCSDEVYFMIVFFSSVPGKWQKVQTKLISFNFPHIMVSFSKWPDNYYNKFLH